MKVIRWIGCIVALCICLSEARYKIRRPLPAPPPQIYKKSWPIGSRISMGNTIHINSNFPPKRSPPPPPPYKTNNYRIRRPPVFNVVPNGWKSHQIPVILNNHAVLPQRQSMKEFHSLNKAPEYSPEYRPENVIIPSAHRGAIDDDKGPIHTIPAPNLSLADKPYNLIKAKAAEKIHDDNQQRHHYETKYNINFPGTSVTPQRQVTSATPTQHQYEVTEANDINIKDYHTISPNYFTPEFESTRISSAHNPEVQANEIYLSHTPISNSVNQIGTNNNNNNPFGQGNIPMQTNLHSSLAVGFPGTASQATSIGGGHQQLPDLHVGHPAPIGPPLSAPQLYDLLNSLPQQLSEQYTNGQQPQLQQHLLQQQLGQYFQTDVNGVTRFSQPQMHSFNYDEQANKNQQQILIGQNYGSGKVTADYNLEPESSDDTIKNIVRPNEELNYPPEVSEQQENNIEFEQTLNQKGQTTHFQKVKNPGSISSQFYTTLPNREAAEKLAALAAAGNVNSHLIDQLKKQQEIQQDEPLPENHKDEDFPKPEQQQETEEELQQKQRLGEKRKQIYQQQRFREQQIKKEQENEQYEQRYRQQQRYKKQRQNNQEENENNKQLRIFVPDVDNKEIKNQSATEKETFEEYEYENDEPESTDTNQNNDDVSYGQSGKSEFGSRLKKTGK